MTCPDGGAGTLMRLGRFGSKGDIIAHNKNVFSFCLTLCLGSHEGSFTLSFSHPWNSRGLGQVGSWYLGDSRGPTVVVSASGTVGTREDSDISPFNNPSDSQGLGQISFRYPGHSRGLGCVSLWYLENSIVQNGLDSRVND